MALLEKSLVSMSEEVLFSFMASHCFMFSAPWTLWNVSVQQSLLRQNGMNLISINFATQFPSPLQVLQRTDSLLTFGLRRDIESFLTAHNGQMMATAHSIRFQQFCRELIRYYVVCCA